MATWYNEVNGSSNGADMQLASGQSTSINSYSYTDSFGNVIENVEFNTTSLVNFAPVTFGSSQPLWASDAGNQQSQILSSLV